MHRLLPRPFLFALCLGWLVPAGAAAEPAAAAPPPIPPALRHFVRKCGPYDYKLTSLRNLELTSYVFGVMCAAANVPRETVAQVAQASEPSAADVAALADLSLETSFPQRQTELTALRDMFLEDSSLTRVASDFTWLSYSTHWPRSFIGISADRWSDYKAHFARAELREGVARSADYGNAIFFIARATGTVTGGTCAGYVYTPAHLKPEGRDWQQTLTAALAPPGKSGATTGACAFVALAPNWYAFYEAD